MSKVTAAVAGKGGQSSDGEGMLARRLREMRERQAAEGAAAEQQSAAGKQFETREQDREFSGERRGRGRERGDDLGESRRPARRRYASREILG